MSILEGSSILITGGTGSFGKAFIEYALENLNPKKIVIFSRDELKQYEVRLKFNNDPRLRFFVGASGGYERDVHTIDSLNFV